MSLLQCFYCQQETSQSPWQGMRGPGDAGAPPRQALRKSIHDVSPEFIDARRPSQRHDPQSVSPLRDPPRLSPGPGGMGVWPELTEGASETMDRTCKRTLKTIKTRKCKKLLLLVRMLLSSALGNVLVLVMCFHGNKNVRKSVN